MDAPAALRRKAARRRAARPKITGRLADLADIKKTGGLLADVQSHRVIQQGKDERRQDVIHPSEMAKSDWCPRSTYYRIRTVRAGGEIPAEKISAQLDAIFEEGNTIHAKWQRWLAEMGRLWGLWKCLACGHEDRYVCGFRPEQCFMCGAHPEALTYAEITLDAEDSHLVVGHADGAVPDLDTMIEIKSIGVGTLRLDAPELVGKHTHKTASGKSVLDLDGLWKSITRPLGSHVRQGNIYLWLAKLMGLPFTKMTFLYEYKATQATKEFTITLSDRVIDPLIDHALDIRWGLDHDTPPDRPAWAEQDHKICGKCPYLEECFEKRTTSRKDRKPAGPAQTPRVRDTGPRAARVRGAETPAGRDRARRPRPDEPLRRADDLGRVPGDSARGGRGRREVSRRVTQNRGGQGGRPAQDREDSGGRQSSGAGRPGSPGRQGSPGFRVRLPENPPTHRRWR